MDPALAFLLLAALSMAFTWWAYFRKCVTIRVAGKSRAIIEALYPAAPTGARGWHPYSVWHAEYQYSLTDDTGRRWVVSAKAYNRARVGRAITLRQWVDEWH